MVVSLTGAARRRFVVFALGLLLALAACAGDVPEPRAEPLAALPPPSPISTDRFRDAETCGQCHLVNDVSKALHDPSGQNVSPVLLWRASMMGLAARDPYYLAVFAEEKARDPGRAAEIDALCTRCHAPAGHEESGGKIGFDTLVADATSPAATLARGGVQCSLCHQIGPDNLSTDASFNGGFKVGYKREIYGPFTSPVTQPMMLMVNYTPTLGSHILDSALCGSCHTVVVGSVVEQATFLEWRSSKYAGTDQTCQGCHVATSDDKGAPIVTAIAGFPTDLSVRSPVGRHDFVGANAYMLQLMSGAVEWLNAGVSAAELQASSARDAAHLTTAARVTIPAIDANGFTVRVENLTGHKLPTGFPTRRMWLRVRVEGSDGRAVFESGTLDARGSIAGGDRQAHRDEIKSSAEAQIWEATLVDANGDPTHRALDARRYGKDDRILPAGWAPSSADAARTASVGVSADTNFVAGSDEVHYRVAVPTGAKVTAELLYQSLSPATLDAIDETKTPAASRFLGMAKTIDAYPMAQATAMR